MPAKRRQRPTILDVARRAGVALGTASNVINGRGNVGEAFERGDASDGQGEIRSGIGTGT